MPKIITQDIIQTDPGKELSYSRLAPEDSFQPESNPTLLINQTISAFKSVYKHVEPGERTDFATFLSSIMCWARAKAPGDQRYKGLAYVYQQDKATYDALHTFFVNYDDLISDVLTCVDIGREKDTYRRTGERIADKESVTDDFATLVQFNQRLSQELFWLLQLPPNSPSRKYIDVYREIIFGASKNNETFGAAEIGREYRGARIQAGLMDYFIRQGYTIIVPNPENEKECFSWDGIGGVDFVAVSKNGRAFLIDAKSTNTGLTVFQRQLDTDPTHQKVHSTIRNQIRKLLPDIDIVNFEGRIVLLPRLEDCMDFSARLNPATDAKLAPHFGQK